jgi:hypothetical protein
MTDVTYVRAIEPVAARHPDHGGWVTLDPSVAMRSDDPLVLAYPDSFQSDADRDTADAPVEQATAAPGERRHTRRRG